MLAAGVVALTVLGLAVRLWDVGAAGVWFDESYHVALVMEPSVGEMIDAILSNPPSAPLYALVLRGWTGLAGHADAAIRLPSVLVGSLTVPAAAWLASELDGRSKVVVLAAALVAFSPYALEFSQEAAPYALAALLVTLAFASGLRWRRTGLIRHGLLAVALAIAAVYAHYAAAAVLGVAWLLGLGAWAGPSSVPRRQWLLAGIAVGAAWLPWLVALVAYWLAAAAPRAALQSPTSALDVLRTLGQYAAGTAAVRERFWPLIVGGLTTLLILVPLGWAAGADARRRGLRMVVVSAAAVLLVPAAVSAATGWWVFIGHFGLLSLPAMAVVAAAGVLHAAGLRERGGGSPTGQPARSPRSPRWRDLRVIAPVILAGAALAIEVTGVALFRLSPPHGADGLRELVARLEADVAPNEPVLVAPAILLPSLRQYTDGELAGIPNDFDLRDIYGPYVHPASEATLREAVRGSASGATRVWLVSFDELPEHQIIIDELSATRRIGFTLKTRFGTLLRFDAASTAGDPVVAAIHR